MSAGYRDGAGRPPPARATLFPTPVPTLALPVRLAAPALLALLAAGALPAQQPAAAPAPAAADPLAGLSAASLQPGRWVYRSTMTRGEQSVELARRTLTVAPAGDSAWLILDVAEARGQSMTDSLLVRRRDLRPLSRAATMGPLRLQATFGPDSVSGALTAPETPGAPIALAMGPGFVANMGMLESALTLLPLHAGWTGVVRQLVANPAGLAVMPLELTVTGEDTVTVPAGRFPSWTVTAASAGTEQRLWLAKADGRLLRVSATPPQMPDLVYETVLVEAPPAGTR